MYILHFNTLVVHINHAVQHLNSSSVESYIAGAVVLHNALLKFLLKQWAIVIMSILDTDARHRIVYGIE